MPAVSGRYIVCPFCNSKKCKKECKSKKEGGISMYDKIYEIIQSADDFVWGWGMIALLLGTHLFLTVRTGFIQRKTITKGIRLSVAKEEGADGEVSQFGALATALASTIGTGNIIQHQRLTGNRSLTVFCTLSNDYRASKRADSTVF